MTTLEKQAAIEKASEAAIKAKERAEAKKTPAKSSTKKTPAKRNKLTDAVKSKINKPVAEKASTEKATAKPEKAAAKKERPMPQSVFTDQVLRKGGTWKEMAKKVDDYSKKIGRKFNYSSSPKSKFAQHIHYRRNVTKQKDFLKGYTITDTELIPPKK